MVELEFYIKKLQDLEARGEWKEVYMHTYEKIHPMIYNSHYLRRNFYIRDLEKFHNEFIDLSFAPNNEEKLRFRKLQKNIIDLLYQVQEENKKIYIVHGNDATMNDKVSSFLGKLRLDYVLIEDEYTERKLKEFKKITKECGYAIILFSAEDLGRNHTSSSDKVRTPQKVIFQTGYFLSHVGRKNLIILYAEDKEIESPFDFEDLAYSPFDSSGNWKSVLIQEMTKSGIFIEKSIV